MKEIVSGIYKIRNTINSHCYIGSAVNLGARKTKHFSDLRIGKHHSGHLQNAYNKYGHGVFIFEVIECCEKERLIEREQFYIDTLHPEYNIAPRAGNCLGVKHTAETRAKLSAAKIGNKHSFGHKNHLGCKHTAEARAKVSALKKGNKNLLGYKHTAEARAKISKANAGKKVSSETRAKMSASAYRRYHRSAPNEL